MLFSYGIDRAGDFVTLDTAAAVAKVGVAVFFGRQDRQRRMLCAFCKKAPTADPSSPGSRASDRCFDRVRFPASPRCDDPAGCERQNVLIRTLSFLLLLPALEL